MEEALTFESMKKILSETAESRKAAEDERRLRITETYKTATFQELLQRNLQRVFFIPFIFTNNLVVLRFNYEMTVSCHLH